MITGTGWLDPRSVRIQFKLNNRDAENNLYLINALPQNFFRRIRILCGGALIDDIDYYNRVVNMLHVLCPAEKRMNDAIEGFGRWPADAQLMHERHFLNISNEVPMLKRGMSKVVLFPLMCGLFSLERNTCLFDFSKACK